jgi:hypothetical protein
MRIFGRRKAQVDGGDPVFPLAGTATPWRLVTFPSADGWRFSGIAPNGEIVFQSESYSSESKALQTANRIAGAAFVVEIRG